MSDMEAKIPKIDENNKIIGETTIDEARRNGWPRRVSRVFIFDEEGNVLLQKRSKNINLYPGLWDCSGGHVDVGETYTEAGTREIKEELGIVADVEEIAEATHFENTFLAICLTKIRRSGEITIDQNEVEDFKWVSVEELQQGLKEHPKEYTPWLLDVWERSYDTLVEKL